MLKKMFKAMTCCLAAAMFLAMGCGTSHAKVVYSASELSKGQVVEFGGDKLVTLSGFEDVRPYHWYVIDIQGSRVMLMWAESIYGARKFHEDRSTNSWARCSLRAWLNFDFVKDAFTGEELKRIAAPKGDTAMGEEILWKMAGREVDTTFLSDRIFLLKVMDIVKYFPSQQPWACPGASAEQTD